MIIQAILLIVGFVILIKGADIFIDGASNIAKNYKLSKALIGLTVVSIGTSAPELAISSNAILSGNGSIVLGNIIGSNIINILLILGICSTIKTIRIKSPTIRREIPMVILITSLVVVLLMDTTMKNSEIDTLTRADGCIILIFLLIFVNYLFSMMRKNKNIEVENPNYSLKKSYIITILGVLAILLGSDLVVNSASNIARYLNISERIIALTIIALGTSLPELASAISATLKGEEEILVGNIIGSNIFNIGLVLGIPLTFFGSISGVGFDPFDIIVLLISTLLLFLFSLDKKMTKKEGIAMLILFVAYYSYIIIKGVII